MKENLKALWKNITDFFMVTIIVVLAFFLCSGMYAWFTGLLKWDGPKSF